MNEDNNIDQTIEVISLQDLLEELETNSVTDAIIVDNTTPILMKDPIAMQVKALRLRGWDNNRIAALLGVSRVLVVDKIVD